MAFVCRGAGWGGGGGPCAAPPDCAARGACRAGATLPPSVPLPSLGRQQSGCHWRCCGHGGRGPHTSPVRARPPSLGTICAASWRVGAVSLFPRGSCESRRLGRGGGWGGGAGRARAPLSGGGKGDHPPCLGGLGPGPPRLAGRWGGSGGGVAPRPLCSPSEGRPAVPYPGCPLVVGALPPGVRVRSGSRGCPGGGGDEGRPVQRSPGGAPSGLNPPSALLEWAMVMGGGHGGRGLHTVLMRRRALSPGLVRAPLWRAGVGLPVGRDPRGSRRLGAPGRAVCRSSRIPPPPPPPRRGPFWGRGGLPSALRGRRVAPVALKVGGGSGGGRGGGGGGPAPPPPATPPCRASACHLLSPACPSGVYSCRGGCRAAAGVGRGPIGRQWVSAAGGGGRGRGTPPPWFAPPSSPGRPPKGPLRVRRPGRRLSAVGRQRAGRERAGRSPGALAAAAVPPHPGCSGLFGGDAGLPSLRSAFVRSLA